ncbi:MAG: AraC family transcriptional regulator [Caulobacter sp.]|nr:AraC family transcriptional regulator [Caulobacter sp.]
MSPIRHTAADEPFFLVRSLAARHEAGRSTGRHAHGWGQLIYCSQGVMTVWTQTGSWVAPPLWAIWVPAGVAHEIRFAGPSALRTLYLRGDLAGDLPAGCAAMTVSALMRELILRTMDLRMLDERQPVHRALASLIVAELKRHDAPPFDLPSPTSEATRRAAEIMQTPGAPLPGAEALARAVGLSGRTLERRFQRETGLTVAGWGRQARLLQGLRGLAAGEPVKRVAGMAGYRSASAFVAAFRAAFGQTPGRYFNSGAGSGPTAWP